MGAVPEWYGVVRAAKYLGVAPWDLMERSHVWVDWALTAEKAEDEAEKARQNRANRRGR